MPEERKPEHLVMVDMTPPNSIANDDLNEPHPPRQDPIQEVRAPQPRTDPTPRPYQSQCRGKFNERVTNRVNDCGWFFQ